MSDPRRSDEVTAAPDEPLDPAEAAQLLSRTSREARQQFSLNPRWTSIVGGVVIMGAYGALWLTTKDQHPYTGPSLGVVGLVYALVVVSIAVSVTVYRRATAGISGPSIRQQRVEGVAILISYLGSPVIQGALKNAGAGNAIVYGMIPAAGPLLMVGTTVLGVAAVKADWPQCFAALLVVVAGIVAAFVGPSAAWLAAGIGLFACVAGYALLAQRPAAHRDA